MLICEILHIVLEKVQKIQAVHLKYPHKKQVNIQMIQVKGDNHFLQTLIMLKRKNYQESKLIIIIKKKMLEEVKFNTSRKRCDK